MLFSAIRKILILLKIDILIKKINDLNIERNNNNLRCLYPSANFYGNCVITNLHKFNIGKGSNIKDAYIESSGGVYIGDYVHSGINLTIFSTNHNYQSNYKVPYDEKIIIKSVKINNLVWIGANVSIVPGVTIGEGAIVGMGAVVTSDVAECAIVGGNPARVIGWRNKELFYSLKEEKKYL